MTHQKILIGNNSVALGKQRIYKGIRASVIAFSDVICLLLFFYWTPEPSEGMLFIFLLKILSTIVRVYVKHLPILSLSEEGRNKNAFFFWEREKDFHGMKWIINASWVYVDQVEYTSQTLIIMITATSAALIIFSTSFFLQRCKMFFFYKPIMKWKFSLYVAKTTNESDGWTTKKLFPF